MDPSPEKQPVTDEPHPIASAPADPPLKNGSDQEHGIFKGRLSRMGFLLANLYWGLILLALFAIGFVIAIAGSGRSYVIIVDYIIGLIISILLIVAAVLSYGFIIRRLHDVGQSGWFALLTLLPGASAVLFIVLLILPGVDGRNQYGEVPRHSFDFRDVSGL